MPAILTEHIGDSLVKRIDTSNLTPNSTQEVTLIVIGIYAVAILILWNMPILGEILYPFKLLVVALHEFSHAGEQKTDVHKDPAHIFSCRMLYWR